MRRVSAASICAALVLIGSLASAQDKPNIVYILVDNWGWGDIGVQGSTIATPRIDAFAAQGVRFTNFNVIQRYTFPQVFDIQNDPSESFELWGNEGYAHAWVMGPVTEILAKLAASMKEYPNIRPGQDFSGYE